MTATAAAALLLLACVPSYADGNFVEPDASGGIPGWFVGWAIFVVVVGIGATAWRVTTAQKLAKRSGMDPGLATQMTLLSDDGLDATYLASSLRQQQPASSSESSEPSESSESVKPAPTTATRLEELKGLLDRGLVTQAEYDERRKAIIDSV